MSTKTTSTITIQKFYAHIRANDFENAKADFDAIQSSGNTSVGTLRDILSIALSYAYRDNNFKAGFFLLEKYDFYIIDTTSHKYTKIFTALQNQQKQISNSAEQTK